MNCREVEQKLVLYLYGDISPWKRRRLERHLERCAACRTLLEQTRTTRQLVADLPEIQVPSQLANSVLQKAMTPAEEPRPIRRPLVLRPAFGFVVVLVFASGVVLTQIDVLTPMAPKKVAVDERAEEMAEVKGLFQQQQAPGLESLGEKRLPAKSEMLAKASIPHDEDGRSRQVEDEGQHVRSRAETALARSVAVEGPPESELAYQFAPEPVHTPHAMLAYTGRGGGKNESLAEPSRAVLCANGIAGDNIRAAFLSAMQLYNKAFQETGIARQALLENALRRFEQVAFLPQKDTWQVLASALCADINRALGEISTAVDLYQGIIKNAGAYPGYAREAQYALFKIEYYDREDIQAARLQAMAIIEEASSDTRASHVSLLMGDRLSETDPRAAAFWYRKAQEICPPNSAGYDRAELALAGLEGRLAEENYILDWWVIGPLQDPEDRRLVTEHPPDREIDLSKEYPGAGGRIVGWKRLSRTDPPHDATAGVVEQGKGFHFHGLMDPDEHVSIYALTYVRVDKKTPARLFIGSDDSVRCWVNDELVWSNPCIRGLSPDQDRVSATLRPGWNKILLKVTNNEGLWGFFFQILDRQGRLLWDLEVDPDAREFYESSQTREK